MPAVIHAVLAPLVFASVSASAQSLTIRGVVVDSVGRSVPFATVTATASERSVVTDEHGRFRLPLERGEACKLRVHRIRYHVLSIDLETCPDSALRLVLTRSPYADDAGPRCGARSTGLCGAPAAPLIETISAGYAHTCALDPDGKAWCWGDGKRLALGDSFAVVRRWPRPVDTPLRFSEIAAGSNYTCALTPDGGVVCWGTNEVVRTWPKPEPLPRETGFPVAGTRLTAGRRHACVLTRDHRALCWGWNVDGETGTGSSGIVSGLIATPTPVAGEHRFASLSAGFGFTCGITTAGRLLCWGSNVDGLLGNNRREQCGDVQPVACSSAPVEIPAPESMRQVSSGTSHACAVGVSGNVYCWGANDHGQLGRVGPGVTVPQPVTVEGVERFANVSSGGIETCAISTTNVLYCWGADARSTRLTGLSPDEVRPRRVATGIRAVSLGQLHACAVTTDAVVRCWGDTIIGAFGIR